MSIDTSALRMAAEAATPGPWQARYGGVVHEVRPTFAEAVVYNVPCVCGEGVEHITGDDAAYVAAANPAVVLELLDEVDRLRAQVANARAHVEGAESHATHFGACSHEWLSIRALTAALTDRAPEATRDAAGPSAGFRGDGDERVVELEESE